MVRCMYNVDKIEHHVKKVKANKRKQVICACIHSNVSNLSILNWRHEHKLQRVPAERAVLFALLYIHHLSGLIM